MESLGGSTVHLRRVRVRRPLTSARRAALAAAALALATLAAGCERAGEAPPGERSAAAPASPPAPGGDPALAALGVDPGRVDPEGAILEVRGFGAIAIRFFPDKAPRHVENFKKLAREGFYDGTTFHRIVPGFVIQGGDPLSKDDNPFNDGTGGPGYTIPAEFNDLPHVRGIVSMARGPDPDSAGSQFFVVVRDARFLDGKYTAFGQVVRGMDVVDRIVAQPRDGRDRPLEPIVIERARIVPVEELAAGS